LTFHLKLFRPLDSAITAGLLILGIWLSAGISGQKGSRAVVYIHGRKVAWYNLQGDVRDIPIKLKAGSAVLHLEPGEVRIKASTCPRKLCVKSGAISHTHQRLVCVPYGLLVKIEGEQKANVPESGQLDAIAH
jgi:hypothetical protein